MTHPFRIGLVLSISAIAVGLTFALPPIAQDPGYHDFADKRAWMGIPNAGDVLSNFAFLVPGVAGLLILRKYRKDPARFENPAEAIPFLFVFAGLVLLPFGSAWYHLNPTNSTLVWDRLPMTLVFMGFFTVIVTDRFSSETGMKILPFLLVLGIASVVYWILTERAGHGDLRPYAVIQFLPAILIPLLIWLFPSRYCGNRYLWEVLGWYLLAKLFEQFDRNVFELTRHTVSGHTLKHLASGLAGFALIRYIIRRRAHTARP